MDVLAQFGPIFALAAIQDRLLVRRRLLRFGRSSLRWVHDRSVKGGSRDRVIRVGRVLRRAESGQQARTALGRPLPERVLDRGDRSNDVDGDLDAHFPGGGLAHAFSFAAGGRTARGRSDWNPARRPVRCT